MKFTKTRVGGVVLTLVAGLTLTGAAGFAQRPEPRGFDGPPPPPFGRPGPGGPHHGGGGGGGLGPLARDLNLSAAQQAQVKQLTDAFEATTKTLREQMYKAGGGPFDELKDGAFDEAAVRAAAQARANTQVELEVAHARLMSQVYALLTAEQKAKLAAHRQQFEQERQRHAPDAKAGETPDDK